MEGMGHPISLAVSGEGVYLGFQVIAAFVSLADCFFFGVTYRMEGIG